MKRKLLTAVALLAAAITLGSISSPMEVYAISSEPHSNYQKIQYKGD